MSRNKLSMIRANVFISYLILKRKVICEQSPVLNDGNNLKLEQVQVIFRHGATTPKLSKSRFDQKSPLYSGWDKECTKVLPELCFEYNIKSINKDILPSFNLIFSNDGEQRGCLTTIGQQQALMFGKWLAQEYIEKHKLIKPEYDQKNVYIRSTVTRRSIASAVGVIAGLFPREQRPVNVTLNIKHEEDDLWPNYNECANIKKRYLQFWDQDRLASRSVEIGLADNEKPLSSKELFDTIRCREAQQLDIPKILLDKRKEISQNALSLLRLVLGENKIEHLRNSVGSFINTICNCMEKDEEASNYNAMILYSAHDTTVISLLLALEIFDNKWPPFMASIIMEVYRSSERKRYVRILYNNSPVKVDGLNEYIPLELFLDRMDKYRVSDWNVNCGNITKR